MSQISPIEASDLLHKLFSEKVPLKTFFVSPSGARVRLDGFLTGANEKGLFITARLDGEGDWINVVPFRPGECVFVYGDTREVDLGMRDIFTRDLGDSAITMRFILTDERFAIFFTI